jgi:aryl-alcohol dehydrogenase-like predicted oxidoreductase
VSVETITLAPGYTVSRLAKGNWQLAARHGAPVSPDAAIEDMRRYVEAGINAFDCADHYIGVEETIGAFRRCYPSLAKQLRVSTKYTPDLDKLPLLKRADVRQQIDLSLQRLGTERLDVVQFHWWDYEIPGCVQAMLWLQELQREGKVAHLGTTNFNVRELSKVLDAGITLFSHQLQYSLLDRRPEHGLVELCRRRGIHLFCYGTVAGGFLSNRWFGQPDPKPPFANRSLIKYRLIIDDFGGWAAFQRLLGVVAHWVLDQPQVALALVGAKDASHLQDNLDVFRLRLDDEDRARLQAAVFGAPGPAGDCYDLERDKNGAHARIMFMNQNTHGAPAHVEMSLPPRAAR